MIETVDFRSVFSFRVQGPVPEEGFYWREKLEEEVSQLLYSMDSTWNPIIQIIHNFG